MADLSRWCQENSLILNVSKTKVLIVDFGRTQLRAYTPLDIGGTAVDRVSSFEYLRVEISKDLTWTTHISSLVGKARQRLFHLRHPGWQPVMGSNALGVRRYCYPITFFK